MELISKNESLNCQVVNLNNLRIAYQELLQLKQMQDLLQKLSELNPDCYKEYLELIISIIQHEFLNSDVPALELIQVGIEYVALELKNTDSKLKISPLLEQEMLNYMNKKGYHIYLVDDWQYYHKKKKDLNREGKYERALYYAHLILEEDMIISQIARKLDFCPDYITYALRNDLSKINKDLYEEVKKKLSFVSRSKYPTIYAFLGDDSVEKVNGFLKMLPKETREILLGFYPFTVSFNVRDNREKLANQYHLTITELQERLTKIKDLYPSYLRGENIHPEQLVIIRGIKNMNLYATFKKEDKNIVRQAISMLNEDSIDFINKIYDADGNQIMDLSEIVDLSGKTNEQRMRKMYHIRYEIHCNIEYIHFKQMIDSRPIHFDYFDASLLPVNDNCVFLNENLVFGLLNDPKFIRYYCEFYYLILKKNSPIREILLASFKFSNNFYREINHLAFTLGVSIHSIYIVINDFVVNEAWPYIIKKYGIKDKENYGIFKEESQKAINS